MKPLELALHILLALINFFSDDTEQDKKRFVRYASLVISLVFVTISVIGNGLVWI